MMEHREKIRRKKSKTAAFCPLLAKLRAATKENGEGIMNIGYLESIFSFLGGLGMFLYGMSIMGDGMQKSAGSKLNSAILSIKIKEIVTELCTKIFCIFKVMEEKLIL